MPCRYPRSCHLELGLQALNVQFCKSRQVRPSGCDIGAAKGKRQTCLVLANTNHTGFLRKSANVYIMTFKNCHSSQRHASHLSTLSCDQNQLIEARERFVQHRSRIGPCSTVKSVCKTLAELSKRLDGQVHFSFFGRTGPISSQRRKVVLHSFMAATPAIIV